MPKIAILVHTHDPFTSRQYFLHEIANIWRESGIETCIMQGPDAVTDADIAILHVDLTVVPDEYMAVLRRYPLALNASVTDISKRTISGNLVRPGDGYRGPVIVKTNRNHGGIPEALQPGQTPLLHRYTDSFFNRLPWHFRCRMPVSEYRIFDSARHVPLAVWLNPFLVVERFLPERRDGCYCLRTWLFLGDRETSSLSWSYEPVVKSNTVIRREPGVPVPDELRRIRNELGFDFGKFDYAVVDGTPVLYDANRTPSLSGFVPELFLPNIRILAEGIRVYLESGRGLQHASPVEHQ